MSDGLLVFGKSESREGFFKANPLELVLTVVLLDDTEFQKKFTINNVAPRDFHQITFSPTINLGDGTFTIEIDGTTNDKDIEIEVPNPGDGDGGDSPVMIAGRGFDIDQPVEVSAGDSKEVILDIEAISGIDALIINIESEVLTPEELETVGLVATFDIANTDPDSELGQNLKNLGFMGDTPIKNQTNAEFNLTAFMPLLVMLGENEVHNFHIKVRSVTGEELEKTLTIETK